MSATIKAGCFLIDVKNKKVGLIYRQKQKDWSFPKGHLEKGESIEQCALREVAEETKRDCSIVKSIRPFVEKYTTSVGEKCICHMFTAVDTGLSDNTSEDTHTLEWVNFDLVENKLSYRGLKKTWNIVKKDISKLFDND